MKYFCQITLVFLLLLPLLGRAQGVRISGRVVDAVTKKPVPFVSISLQDTDTGVLSNEAGYFQIQGLVKTQQDSLVCMTLTYRRKSVLIKQGLMDSLKVEMIALPFGFTVAGPCIVTGKKTVPLSKIEKIEGLPTAQYAFFFGCKKSKRYGNLRELAFYTGGNGFPKSRFRLHIYEAQNAYASPGKDLLNENIVLNPNPCEGWDNWDLSSFNIPVSEKGYFIALEFVLLDAPFVDIHAYDYRSYGQFMRPSKEQNIWSYSKFNGWREVPATGSISRQYNTMLKVAVDLVK